MTRGGAGAARGGAATASDAKVSLRGNDGWARWVHAHTGTAGAGDRGRGLLATLVGTRVTVALGSRLRGNDERRRGNDEGRRGNDERRRGSGEGRRGNGELYKGLPTRERQMGPLGSRVRDVVRAVVSAGASAGLTPTRE